MQMSERSEFLRRPIFISRNWEPEGQRYLRRLFWVTFFGEAKKVTGCRATPDLYTSRLDANESYKRKAGDLVTIKSTNDIRDLICEWRVATRPTIFKFKGRWS
jgi:hypothetical protein